jgi:AraC-like DNA-binding protein
MARNPVFDVLSRLLHPRPRKLSTSPEDLRFLEHFREVVARHQREPEFTTAAAATSLGMSRMHLNRKLRVLTGHSTHQYIQTIRLDGARAMLSEPLPVGFIARSFGFKNRSHFAKAFRKRFGVTPTAFRFTQSLARQPPTHRPSGK